MKIILISAILCLAGLTHGANVQRLSRNTEAIIPTIVEEILKVELQSDLKKNSDVEAEEVEPVIKLMKEEIIVEPVASRTIEEAEKMPEMAEVVAVKEVMPEPIEAVLKTEPAVEIIEKVEIMAVKEEEKPVVDNFRTESVPSVDIIPEMIKETIVIETVPETRLEPVQAVIVKEEEIVTPMVRNVIKEEIPQVEELRNVVPVEVEAVKDIVPEPVAALNVAAPVVEVEPQVKTVTFEADKEEKKEEIAVVPEIKSVPETVVKVEVVHDTPVVPEIKAVPVVPEIKTVPVVPEVKVEPEVKFVPEVPFVPEVKAVPEVKTPVEVPVEVKVVPEIAAIPSVEESSPEIRQDRPTIIQQIQDTISNVPVVGQIFNRNPATTAADETVGDESTATTTTQRPILQFAQNALSNTQQFFQSTLQNLNPAATNAGDTERPPSPLAGVVQFAQTAFQNAQNAIFPTTTQKSDEPQKEKISTTDAPEKPMKAEPEAPVEVVEEVKEKSVHPKLAVVVQKEVDPEPKKAVDEEKENVVKV